MQKDININEKEITKTMKEAAIPIVSYAFVGDGKILREKQLTTDDSNETVNAERMFGAASLSKPVFAYLVLKLVSEGKISLDSKLIDMLPFDEFCKNNNFEHDKTVTKDVLQNLTVEMILSHSSGMNLANGSHIESEFKPGTQYSYSNLGILYLQKAIENKLESNLQTLAQEYIFGSPPKGLDMKHSCFYRDYELDLMTVSTPTDVQKIYLKCTEDGLHYQVLGLDGKPKEDLIPWDKLPKGFPQDASKIISAKKECLAIILDHTASAGHTTLKEAVAPNSLFTTAHDYATFINAWMNSPDEIMQKAFMPVISMTTDDWAKELDVPERDLEKVAWGLGWGLQLNDQDEVVTAYHTADMNEWRAQVAINMKDKTGIVYFTNSKHGHILSDQIISPNANLEHGLNYFFQKYGFARNIEKGYTLGLMSNASRKASTIYLESTEHGLRCVHIDPHGKQEKSTTIPWNHFSKDFPKNPSEIIRLNNKFLPTILLEEIRFSKIGQYLNPPGTPVQAKNKPTSKTENSNSTGNILSELTMSKPTNKTVPPKPSLSSTKASQNTISKTDTDPISHTKKPSVAKYTQKIPGGVKKEKAEAAKTTPVVNTESPGIKPKPPGDPTKTNPY